MGPRAAFDSTRPSAATGGPPRRRNTMPGISVPKSLPGETSFRLIEENYEYLWDALREPSRSWSGFHYLDACVGSETDPRSEPCCRERRFDGFGGEAGYFAKRRSAEARGERLGLMPCANGRRKPLAV